MRNFLFFFVLFCCFSSKVLYAQSSDNNERRSWRFGARAGLTLSDADVDYTTISQALKFNTELSSSFYAAAFTEYFFTRKLALHGELGYIQNGFFQQIGSNSRYHLRLHHITMPVLLKFDKILIFSFGIGGYASYLLSAKADDGKTVEDVKSDYHSFDAGLILATELHLGLGLFIDLRYQQGLVNVFNVKGLNAVNAEGLKQNNRSFQLGVGFRF